MKIDQILNRRQHHHMTDPLYFEEGSGRRGRTTTLQSGLPAHCKTFPTHLTYQQAPDQKLQNLRNPARHLNS